MEGTLVKILNKKGIQVQHTFLRAKGLIKNKQYEIDMMAKNGEQVVAVEVKTTLSVEDVKHFMKIKGIQRSVPGILYESSNRSSSIYNIRVRGGSICGKTRIIRN
ncbi:MAG: hypothetical protein ACPL1A_05390 [Candidatus Kapaibacteriota bacterium]